jgi:hypothetical protein
MVDTENLIFVENSEEFLIERAGAGEVGAERFFDDKAPPGAARLARQARLAEMASDRCEGCRRGRQIEQPVTLRAVLALDAGQLSADFLVGLVLVGLALDLSDARQHLLDHTLVDLPRCEFRQAVGKTGAKRLA